MQLAAMAKKQQGLQLTAPRYNPRPAGVIHEGSATHAVLVFLTAHPRRFFSHCEITRQVNRTPKSVDFALRYLRELGQIEITSDEPRNSRYLRYSIKGSSSIPL
jgi:hypothetical protein